MFLSDLLLHLPGGVVPPGQDVRVTGIAHDSRRVESGYVFVALTGGTTDGHRFIPDAVRRGTAAVVGTEPLAALPVPYVQVTDSRQALAYLSAAFYGLPARELVVIGVTGTDGKTTTSNLIFHILQVAGYRTGMISTVSAVIGGETLDTGFHVTTPEAPDVQRFLARMVSAGLTHVVLEATSHGLAQHRVTACDFDIGVVTNITHEHLDYHGSYEAYRSAKASLFAGLAQTPSKKSNPPRGAVLNRDDGSYAYLSEITRVRRLAYSLEPGADVWAEEVTFSLNGASFTAIGRDARDKPFRASIRSPLPGEFNVSNCLAAIACTAGLLGVEIPAVEKGIAFLPGVPGRMEQIEMGQDFTAIVDFAHTPNALRRTLEAARRMLVTRNEGPPGRVIAVFGSAGLRDRLKRRMMAETSADLADLTILTAEDPRTESLPSILAEMALGAESHSGVERETFWRIPDRREAIRFAVAIARPRDMVLVCGKGHEQSMCFGETEYAWDDRVALRAALAELLGISGPEMPFLPD